MARSKYFRALRTLKNYQSQTTKFQEMVSTLWEILQKESMDSFEKPKQQQNPQFKQVKLC